MDARIKIGRLLFHRASGSIVHSQLDWERRSFQQDAVSGSMPAGAKVDSDDKYTFCKFCKLLRSDLLTINAHASRTVCLPEGKLSKV